LRPSTTLTRLVAKSRRGETHGVVWRLPAYNIVHNVLTNPVYAGAYAFGQTGATSAGFQEGRQSKPAGAFRLRGG